MKLSNVFIVCFSFLTLVSCTRIETGEVGVRIGFDKQISPGELLPGSFNQTIIGSVLTFPVKDVSVRVEDMTPLAKDNSTMKDFDAMVVYSINPQSVSELYVSKNRSFHSEHDGDIYLMYNYIHQTARNAIYKSARKYDALDMNDNRQAIETEVKDLMIHSLAEEKLDTAINISQVLVRVILPADSVVASANELVRAKNEYKQKEVEVQTAKKEAERIAALNANKGAIEYMSAMANMKVAEAIANGKVHTIVVPMDFKGMLNVGK
ncbi:MAG: SPFH domain-containing protein [Bdellovibrionales bacterium]|nr:SPFH domain-containing protein [Bdellovibrionales bacterium]